MKLAVSLWAFLAVLLAAPSTCHSRTHYGLIGYGIDISQPLCAFACRQILMTNELDCNATKTAECRATSDPYLLSLALCLDENCRDETETWELERFWSTDAGSNREPEYGYYAALGKVDQNATWPAVSMYGMLNSTGRVERDEWRLAYLTIGDWVYVEGLHSGYG
jgi:hypothetical protein